MKFFTAEDYGFAAKFNAVADKLADQETGLLTIRYTTIGETIAEKNEKLEFMGARLDILESRLYADFTAMELSIAKMQSNLDFLDSIQYIKMPNKNND
jgi:flagellar capping protein FliD